MSDDQGNTTPVTIPKSQTDLISTAFAKAQGSFKQPELNRTAEIKKEGKLLYTTTYADLNQCIECVRKSLSDNELSFTQTVEPVGNQWLLVLTLRHSSGQSLKSFMPVTVTGSPQVIGGQLTYLKRYQISAFFGLAADFDDDGNAGSNTGNVGEFGDPKKGKGKDSAPKSERPLTSKEKAAAETKPKDPAIVSPENTILPTWGGSNKGKKIGSLDTATLSALRDHMKTMMTAKPKPKHIGEIAHVYAQIKAVLIDRTPTPADEFMPENINPETGEAFPEYEDQSQEPPEPPVGPAIDDFVIPSNETTKGLMGFEGIIGQPLKRISEKELRTAVTIIDSALKATPPNPNVSIKELFDLRSTIVTFFKTMDVKL